MPHPVLTARQTQVLRLALDGKSNVQIAAALFVSTTTVKVHLADIRDRLGLNGAGRRWIALAAYALGRADEAAVKREGETG